MQAFRTLLVLMIAALFAYTGIVGVHHGWNLFPIFFGDIVAMTWPGQFNLDFTCLLTFTGLWLAWRHHFTPSGLALGLLGCVGGTAVLAPYLLVASYRANGDMKVLLLGKRRAG
jgi:hypothetical protein